MSEEKTTILVVEDDANLLKGIRDILENEGYDVVLAANGAEGMDVLDGMPVPPDLIISDIMMPRMDGHQFYEAVNARDDWNTIPFIFLTAKGEPTDIRRGYQLGASQYLVKPMEPEDLLVRVSSNLRSYKRIMKKKDSEIEGIKNNIMTILNHEFRTPLTYIVAYSDLATTDPENLTPDDLRQFLRGIETGAARFRRLVENFIALVELDSGEAANNFKWRSYTLTDVRPVCAEVIEMLRSLAEDRGVRLELHIPDNVPGFVGDYEYLRAALRQLVENAIKFSDKPDARVELRANTDGEHVFFVVQDWGRGIAVAELDNIWKPFYQINRAEHEDQGAGSGLSIVRGIIEMHGGTITVESTPGEGSTFTITLPCQAAPVGQADPAADDDYLDRPIGD